MQINLTNQELITVRYCLDQQRMTLNRLIADNAANPSPVGNQLCDEFKRYVKDIDKLLDERLPEL